jgi:hypothetical protein
MRFVSPCGAVFEFHTDSFARDPTQGVENALIELTISTHEFIKRLLLTPGSSHTPPGKSLLTFFTNTSHATQRRGFRLLP